MFAATGWRVGWLIGPEAIIGPSLAAQTRIVFCTNSPLQEAAAAGLEQAKARNFFASEVADYAERRQIIVDAFDSLGLKYTLPEGTYFILLVRHVHSCVGYIFPRLSQDISDFDLPEGYPYPESVIGRGRDFKCVYLIRIDYGI